MRSLWNRNSAKLIAAFSVAMLFGCGPEYPNCGDDNDCHQGEFCVNGQCQQCRTDGDCELGQHCNAGRCDPIEGYCGSTSDCGAGEDCENNRCVARQSVEPTPAAVPQTSDCSLQEVHFEFDSDSLDSGARDAIAANARCIRERSMGRVHVTGYTDNRGTEEYNLALGDRRARAVLDYLRSLGVTASLSASSMGEEMAQGETEGAWRQDRKVTFIQR